MLWENAKTTAALLVDLHGATAYDVALKRFDDCTLFGDEAGEIVWGDILSELTLWVDFNENPMRYFTVH